MRLYNIRGIKKRRTTNSNYEKISSGNKKRYSPSALCSNFSLTITNDDPRTVKEAVD